MHIGFTGTQEGMTPPQFRDLAYKLVGYYDNWSIKSDTSELWFHHGDCKGADAQAARLAKPMGYLIHVHPPDKPNKRAFVGFFDEDSIPKPYLDRNHDIVDACDVLIAAPKGPEELRSGTWATIRYARKVGKPVIILDP